MEDTMVLTLRAPIKIGEISVTELRLREPTAAEIDRAQAPGLTGMRSNIILVAAVSGTPVDVIEKIGSRDMREATDFLESFIRADPKTGSSS